MARTIFIGGAPFLALFHRDGRFIRSPGLFAFAAWDGRRHLILHLELAEAVNQQAGPGHPRWGWALSQGLNELLVCPASARASVAAYGPPELVEWHRDVEVWFGDAVVEEDNLKPRAARVGAL